MKKGKYTVTIGILIGCACLMVLFRQGQQQDASRQKPQTPVAHNIQKRSGLGKKAAITPVKIVAKTAEEKKTELPFVEHFVSLQSKLLKKSSELKEYQALLSNRDQLAAAAAYLAAPPSGFEFGEQNYRLKLIDYLAEAAKWQDNPAAGFAVDTIHKLVLADNIADELPLDIRKAIAQDKVELFSALIEADPETANTTKNKALGTEVAQIIRYAELTYGDVE